MIKKTFTLFIFTLMSLNNYCEVTDRKIVQLDITDNEKAKIYVANHNHGYCKIAGMYNGNESFEAFVVIIEGKESYFNNEGTPLDPDTVNSNVKCVLRKAINQYID